MNERCFEQERLAYAVVLAVTATNRKRADRIRAIKENRNADPQTVALFDARAKSAERSSPSLYTKSRSVALN